VPVEYQREEGSMKGDLVRVFDFDNAGQQRVSGGQSVHGDRKQPSGGRTWWLFVNGLPIAVIELKNAADSDADIWRAFNQIQTYKQQIPSLFAFNEICVISDGE
jgi:type I restriction enzyme R subunit